MLPLGASLTRSKNNVLVIPSSSIVTVLGVADSTLLGSLDLGNIFLRTSSDAAFFGGQAKRSNCPA